MKYIKNNTLSNKTWVGAVISAGSYYGIEIGEEIDWANDSELLSDIGSGDALVAEDSSGTTDITDVNSAINFLKNSLPAEINQGPFATKTILVGGVRKSLFKRVHGTSATITAGQTGNIDFTIPYTACKFTGANIFGVDLEDTLNFKIMDTATNAYSGAPTSPLPNYYPSIQINQFGFDVEMPAGGVYENTSNYDADLYPGMIVRCEYTNNGASDKYISMNLWLHEVKG